MIQDIYPEHYAVEYQIKQPKADDCVFAFKTRSLFGKLTEDHRLLCPTVDKLSEKQIEDLQYLFQIGSQSYYLYDGILKIEGYTYENIGKIRSLTHMKEAFSAMTAYHLYVWYDSHRFCGKCGQRMRLMTKERAVYCPSCGLRSYPVIAPAVIIGVVDGDNILITRYAGREYTGVALLAGFCEIGESAEDTVRREVMEEVGLKIKNIRYFGSQPWGVDSNLLLGYFAEVDGSTEICMDTQELREAVWMPREKLKPAKNLMSLTMTMIEAFRKHDEKERTL